MKENPILFSAPMVKAILEGKKTQTRRVITPHNSELSPRGDWARLCWDSSTVWRKRAGWPEDYLHVPFRQQIFKVFPRWKIEDRLWVKEPWWVSPAARKDTSEVRYKANTEDMLFLWKSSLVMPQWASRITLEILAIRAQRIQDITEEDALAEGMRGIAETGFDTARYRFRVLWDKLNAKRGYGWDKNPWVWVINFALRE